MQIGDILHFIIEQIAIDSGILFSSCDIKEAIAKSDMSKWSYFFDKNPEEFYGVRPEFIEDIIRVLRASVRNLSDSTDGFTYILDKIKSLEERGVNTDKLIDAFNEVLFSKEIKNIDEKVIEEIVGVSKQERFAVEEIIEGINQYQNRNLKLNYSAVEWDSLIELSKLFEGEIIPDNPEEYFDQWFLDYLAKNEVKLENIHWRNFERLCAEFFKKKDSLLNLVRQQGMEE